MRAEMVEFMNQGEAKTDDLIADIADRFVEALSHELTGSREFNINVGLEYTPRNSC